MMKLIIGSPNFSSWSLRPWLLMKYMELPFQEVVIQLRQENTRSEILKHSPSGRVPCLIDDDIVIWDSLAIAEYLAEKCPALWPREAKLRAEARALSAEMHAGFAALRTHLPMDIRAENALAQITPEVTSDIARIISIFESCRGRFATRGHFLFGEFSIADAMFSPVVWRFLTYKIELPEASRHWVSAMRTLPAMRAWRNAALADQSTFSQTP